jgi:hypothetical protein
MDHGRAAISVRRGRRAPRAGSVDRDRSNAAARWPAGWGLLRFRGIGQCRGKEIRLQGVDRRPLLELAQLSSGRFQHRGGNSRQRGDLNPVTLVGRAFLDGVQEDDALAVLDGVQMDIGQFRSTRWPAASARSSGWQTASGSGSFEQVATDGESQRHAVEGRGAAADLVHQHQAAFGGVMQDGGRFGHLDHEGRTPAGQVVGGADAGEDLVERAENGSGRPARSCRCGRAGRSAPSGACRSICRPCSGR